MDHIPESQPVRPPDKPKLGSSKDTSEVVSSVSNSRLVFPPSSDEHTALSFHSHIPSDSSPSHKRNASPSRASIHSTSSTITTSTASANVPQLKRKHGHKHMRQQLHSTRPAPATSTTPNTVADNIPASASNQSQSPAKHNSPSKSLLSHLARSNTAPSPKRPPASHSSYGVETIVGPPPSFDTRRTLSQERVWRGDRSKSLRMTLGTDRVEAQQQQPLQTPQSSLSQAVVVSNGGSSEPKHPTAETPQLAYSSPDTADTQSIQTPTDGEELAVMDVRNEQGLGLNQGEADSKTSSESHKSEDLFLNIARVDASRPLSSKGEKRKSRVSLPFLAGNRPATSHNLQTTQFANTSSLSIPRSELVSYHNKSSSLQLGQTRGLDQVSEQGSTDVSNSGNYSKRSSTLYADTIRPAQRSNVSLRNNRLVSESGYVDRSKFGEQNATESTASTTAPSTVWDELDDLKSRIRKLELTGKLPPSSAAAMSSAERPRTATTAATTLSSSPKHNKMPSQFQPTMEGISPNVHPLLQEAVGNAKAVVSHDVYQSLQSSVQDALHLASLASFDTNSVRSGVPATTERQIRRRTESLCRSLTELAIALAAESKGSQPAYRPASREYHVSPATGLRSRRYSQSNEPMDRPPVSMRVQSRLESRRVSTQHGYSPTVHTPAETDSPAALPSYPQSTARTTRVASTYRSRRTQGLLDGANDEEEASPAIRPISRAMTDVNSLRRPSRDHGALSREYTSQHPMPSQTESPATTRTPLPSNLSTNFISRRKYHSPAAQQPTVESSPLASRQSWGRISIVHQDNVPASDTVSEAPASNRSVSARRSLGFASRLGSSVGNRLRAARTERIESRSYKEPPPQAMSGENGSGESTVRVSVM